MKLLTLKTLVRIFKYVMYMTNFSPWPFRIQADLTDRCNFLCPTCSKWKVVPPEEMSTEIWKNILRKLSHRTLSNRITFCGGEALLRDDAVELIGYAKKLGYFVSIITNGFLLNESLLKKLEEAGLDNLVISLNGVKAQTHDISRGIEGSFKRIIEVLPKLSNYQIKVNLETIIMGTNIDEIIPLAELAKEYNLYGISYQVLADVNAHYALVNEKMDNTSQDWYQSDKFWVKDPSKAEAVIKELIVKQRQGYPILNSEVQLKKMVIYYAQPKKIAFEKCLSGVSTLYIDPYGQMRLCYGFEPIGNINRDDPLVVWNSSAAHKMRSKMKSCREMCRLLNNNF